MQHVIALQYMAMLGGWHSSSGVLAVDIEMPDKVIAMLNNQNNTTMHQLI